MEERIGYRKLVVYERMMELVLLVYVLIKMFPDYEKYGLASQMRRAVVSIISNFVEGYLKKSIKEKKVYLERSLGSLHEVGTQTEVSYRLGYIEAIDYNKYLEKEREVGYLLDRYTKAII